MIKANRSPFDGDLIYWSIRLGAHPEMEKTIAKLLKNQDGQCAYCRQYFIDGDLLEKDHKLPRSLGGKNSYSNLQLLHRHCHDKKTANDGSLTSSNIKEAVK
jgi:5-methylcytosine-specific restriction endonuclease McrA